MLGCGASVLLGAAVAGEPCAVGPAAAALSLVAAVGYVAAAVAAVGLNKTAEKYGSLASASWS